MLCLDRSWAADTTCIVERQRAYLDHGIRSLQPLSRAGIAEELGIHESTVSRATASKYALLPNGEVIPYSHFFTPSLSVKDIMKEVIDKEGKPLTDHDVQERLETQGIHIARRTVSKYESNWTSCRALCASGPSCQHRRLRQGLASANFDSRRLSKASLTDH